MAEKALKTLKFPGIETIYTIPEIDNTLNVSGAAADAAAVRALVNSNVTVSANYGTELPTDNLTEGRVFYLLSE